MKILILEDNQDRIDAFKEVLSEYDDLEIHIWKAAYSFIEEVDEHLQGTDVISLDHDLVSDDGSDPGDGLEVAEYLRDKEPICPVIIHSTNINRSWSMHRELKDGNWDVERYPPLSMGVDWIYKDWINAIKKKTR